MDLRWIVHSISTVFMMFAIEKFMHVFFKERRTSFLIFALAYITYPVLTICAFTFLDVPFVHLACNIGTIFLITLNYDSSWLRRLSAVFFIYIFIFIADLLVVTLLGVSYIPINVRNSYDGVIGYIAAGLLFYLESLLAQNFKNIKKGTPVSIAFWISTFAIPLFSVYLTIVILSSVNLNQIVIISVIAIIFFINILTFYLHDSLSAAYSDKLKSSLFEREKEYYYNQCELMHKSVEELKSFRHDVKNLLFTATDFIQQNQIDEALSYLKKLIGRTEYNTNYSRTGNIAFDSIINYKLRNAEEQGIELQVDVSVPQKLNVEIADVVSIIGNLIDNAINAVVKAEERKICLKIAFAKGNIVMNIQNTFNGKIQRVNGEIVTTGGDGHGYGLKNVRNAVEKYNGYVDIQYIGKLFSVDVFFYAQAA